ncbi:hypothetical protein PUNSTDRAFT_134863 [Punctularia strigosozonata HHB-11173 SS5]|uniref:uncharacterized protein n=1 Tax=Punctularia strigosozonata (strain HHB-11173) TaxID=741275 RepID=UPI00044181C9|nr:uncharacterized protein PUNSTDRAFT_134863 [Punctularia strigosozonata HHB-11173 SS5]EIN08485.1 hypothetical protein PUNSTDRAFT_134863 [Punctularia strigosozonata HHB-11173 SS5]
MNARLTSAPESPASGAKPTLTQGAAAQTRRPQAAVTQSSAPSRTQPDGRQTETSPKFETCEKVQDAPTPVPSTIAIPNASHEQGIRTLAQSDRGEMDISTRSLPSDPVSTLMTAHPASVLSGPSISAAQSGPSSRVGADAQHIISRQTMMSLPSVAKLDVTYRSQPNMEVDLREPELQMSPADSTKPTIPKLDVIRLRPRPEQVRTEGAAVRPQRDRQSPATPTSPLGDARSRVNSQRRAPSSRIDVVSLNRRASISSPRQRRASIITRSRSTSENGTAQPLSMYPLRQAVQCPEGLGWSPFATETTIDKPALVERDASKQAKPAGNDMEVVTQFDCVPKIATVFARAKGSQPDPNAIESAALRSSTPEVALAQQTVPQPAPTKSVVVKPVPTEPATAEAVLAAATIRTSAALAAPSLEAHVQKYFDILSSRTRIVESQPEKLTTLFYTSAFSHAPGCEYAVRIFRDPTMPGLWALDFYSIRERRVVNSSRLGYEIWPDINLEDPDDLRFPARLVPMQATVGYRYEDIPEGWERLYARLGAELKVIRRREWKKPVLRFRLPTVYNIEALVRTL